LGTQSYVAIDPVTADVLSDASSYAVAVAAAAASGGRVVPLRAGSRT
jgi:hypothetical protein